jgi:putative glycosyltransferase (TIGR04372 family)
MREDEFLKNGKSVWIQYIADKLFDSKSYFVFNPWCQRIGHLAFETHTAACVAKRDRKKLVLIPHYKPVNVEIFNCNFNCEVYRSKDIRAWLLHYLLVLSGFCNWFYNGCRNRAVKYVPFVAKVLPSIFFYPRIGIEKGRWWRHRVKGTEYYYDFNLLMSENIKATLNPDQMKRGDVIRGKIGLPEDIWFVCLHVREQGYLGSYPHHNHRDSNILNYIPAIEYIIEKGGYVVRMGDASMRPLPKMKRVIDYAVSEYRSGLMDLYFVSESRFFLGCDSGPFHLAWLFNKPLCSVNFAGPEIIFYKNHNIIVPKHVFSVKEGRVLSFKELILSDVYTEGVTSNRYFYIENTPDEILNTVKEYIELLERNNISDWNQPLQQYIIEAIRSRLENLISQESVDEGNKEYWAGRLNGKGMIGKYYLKNCWEYGPYLEELTLEFKEKEKLL